MPAGKAADCGRAVVIACRGCRKAERACGRWPCISSCGPIRSRIEWSPEAEQDVVPTPPWRPIDYGRPRPNNVHRGIMHILIFLILLPLLCLAELVGTVGRRPDSSEVPLNPHSTLSR